MPTVNSTSSPRVSVIIPSYKTADLIAGCLDSVFAQSYTDFEAIVVNDGSPDTPQLEKVLDPYMERIVYLRQENKRAAGARNHAIRHARGEFLAFLDSDDSWMPDHLARQMRLFAADPSLDLVYSNSLLVGDPRHEVPFMDKCPSEGEATFPALIVERCQVAISTVVARKRVIVDAGLFDENLLRCDDYDMWLRAAFCGAKIGYSRNIQARMFIGRPGSLGQSRARMAEGCLIILEKMKQSLPLKDSDRELVTRRADEIRARYQLEEAKCKLATSEFAEARNLIAEANRYFQRSSLRLALFGLGFAPKPTAKLVSLWTRLKEGASG